MIDVIKALIPIINTALMCVILNLINARKSRRIRQLPLVVFSFISMIIAIPVIIKNYDRIEKIIGFVSPLLHSSLVIVNMLLTRMLRSGRFFPAALIQAMLHLSSSR